MFTWLDQAAAWAEVHLEHQEFKSQCSKEQPSVINSSVQHLHDLLDKQVPTHHIQKVLEHSGYDVQVAESLLSNGQFSKVLSDEAKARHARKIRRMCVHNNLKPVDDFSPKFRNFKQDKKEILGFRTGVEQVGRSMMSNTLLMLWYRRSRHSTLL